MQTRKRKYLCGDRTTHGKRQIDMYYVYKELDAGRTVKSVAEELGVSRATIYRRHREIQEEIDMYEKEYEQLHGTDVSALPPLPPEFE